MTRFENSLGGKVVVMGLTLDNNRSQALYNYRRQKLIKNMLSWCSENFWYVKDAPDVFALVNIPKDETDTDFKAMVTLINLCEDNLNEIKIHIPKNLNDISKIFFIDAKGEKAEVEFERIENDIIVKKNINYLLPQYLIIK